MNCVRKLLFSIYHRLHGPTTAVQITKTETRTPSVSTVIYKHDDVTGSRVALMQYDQKLLHDCRRQRSDLICEKIAVCMALACSR
jgi:hypothetical protein